MIYGHLEIVSKVQYERLCDELSETVEENKQLEMSVEYLKAENEKLLAIINNFNKALEMLGGVK